QVNEPEQGRRYECDNQKREPRRRSPEFGDPPIRCSKSPGVFSYIHQVCLLEMIPPSGNRGQFARTDGRILAVCRACTMIRAENTRINELQKIHEGFDCFSSSPHAVRWAI